MEYHYRRPLPERRSAVAHWLQYIRATADRRSGGGLKPRKGDQRWPTPYRTLSRPLPERRSAVAYVYQTCLGHCRKGDRQWPTRTGPCLGHCRKGDRRWPSYISWLSLGKLPASWVVLGSWSIIFLWLLSCKFLWGAD